MWTIFHNVHCPIRMKQWICFNNANANSLDYNNDNVLGAKVSNSYHNNNGHFNMRWCWNDNDDGNNGNESNISSASIRRNKLKELKKITCGTLIFLKDFIRDYYCKIYKHQRVFFPHDYYYTFRQKFSKKVFNFLPRYRSSEGNETSFDVFT